MKKKAILFAAFIIVSFITVPSSGRDYHFERTTGKECFYSENRSIRPAEVSRGKSSHKAAMVNSSDITGIGPSSTLATAGSGSARYRSKRAHTPKVETASGGIFFTENSKVSALPSPQPSCTPPSPSCTPPSIVDLEKGEKLISSSGCISCHQTDQKITGPAYIEIAKRYPPTEANIAALTAKIINGGAGNWGQMSMDPHPNLKEVDVREMVKYILSLNKKL